ncbi:MAG: helix-turn-helix transcriptional regulator [Planctomycetota bacterium]
MLAKTVIDDVLELLAEGKLSQRKIAETVGVSRGTVSALATGKRGVYGAEPADPEAMTIFCCPGCNNKVCGRCVRCDAASYAERSSCKASRACQEDDCPGCGPGPNDPTPEEIRQRALEQRKNRQPTQSPARPPGSTIRVIAEADIDAALLHHWQT